MSVQTPLGLGVYLTRSAYAPEASRRAARAAASRVRWVALCVGGDDGWRPTPHQVATVMEAYRGHDIIVHVWQLDPADSSARGQAEWLLGCAADADGVILDLEAAWKGRPAEVEGYVSACVSWCRSHGLPLGVTSYPIRSMHPQLPWQAIDAAGSYAWGGPQVYRTAERPALARRALSEWRVRYPAGVVPHLAGYDVSGSPDTQAAQLRRHLRAYGETAPAVAIWSDPALDREERAVLAEYARGRGW